MNLSDKERLLLVGKSEDWVNGSVFPFPNGAGSLVAIAPADIDLSSDHPFRGWPKGVVIGVTLEAGASVVFESPFAQLIMPSQQLICESPTLIIQGRMADDVTVESLLNGKDGDSDVESRFRLHGVLDNPSERRTKIRLYFFHSILLPEYFIVRMAPANSAGCHFECPDFNYKYAPHRNGRLLVMLPAQS